MRALLLFVLNNELLLLFNAFLEREGGKKLN